MSLPCPACGCVGGHAYKCPLEFNDPPSPEPAGETNAAPVNDLCRRLEALGDALGESNGSRIIYEAADALRELEQEVLRIHHDKVNHFEARILAERRAEELREMLKEALGMADQSCAVRIAAIRKAAGL